MLYEQVNKEVEIPEEIALTFDLLPKEDVVTMVSLSTQVASEAEPSLSLEGTRAAKALLIDDSASIPDPVDPSGTAAQFLCRPRGRPCKSPRGGVNR